MVNVMGGMSSNDESEGIKVFKAFLIKFYLRTVTYSIRASNVRPKNVLSFFFQKNLILPIFLQGTN